MAWCRSAAGMMVPMEDMGRRGGEGGGVASFAPAEDDRKLAVSLLQLACMAIAARDTKLVGEIVARAEAGNPDDTSGAVAACIGLALGMLDKWLSGQDADAPAGLAGLI